MGALAILAAAFAFTGAPCALPGEWSRTRDAGWLWLALRRAGYRDIGCTGERFIVVYRGTGFWGHDAYVWAITAPRLTPEVRRFRTIAGVRIYGYYEHRAVWRAGRRNVWIEGGPTTYRLPPLLVLTRIVRATLRR